MVVIILMGTSRGGEFVGCESCAFVENESHQREASGQEIGSVFY